MYSTLWYPYSTCTVHCGILIVHVHVYFYDFMFHYRPSIKICEEALGKDDIGLEGKCNNAILLNVSLL